MPRCWDGSGCVGRRRKRQVLFVAVSGGHQSPGHSVDRCGQFLVRAPPSERNQSQILLYCKCILFGNVPLGCVKISGRVQSLRRHRVVQPTWAETSWNSWKLQQLEVHFPKQIASSNIFDSTQASHRLKLKHIKLHQHRPQTATNHVSTTFMRNTEFIGRPWAPHSWEKKRKKRR